MTTPQTSGDYVTPGGNQPTPTVRTSPGTRDDLGVQTSMPSVVEVQEQAWRARADAASHAAEELRKCRVYIANVLHSNYFGESCVEGQRIYAALRQAVAEGETSWSSQLTTRARELQELSDQCTRAVGQLSRADRASEVRFDV